MFGNNKKINYWIYRMGDCLSEHSDYINKQNLLVVYNKGEWENHVVIDEPIVFVNKKNFSKSLKWDLYINQKIDLDKNISDIYKFKLKLDAQGLQQKIVELKKNGYKIKLFTDIEDKSLKRLGAIKRNKVQMNLERNFINVIIE